MQIRWKASLISGLISSTLGIAVSFIVNSTLAEISINPFFSLVSFTQYFGILFIILGGVIACRVHSQTVSESRKKYFLAFGGLIILSGVLCFILEKNWFVNLGPHVKIPLYGLLGVSISYALTFAIVDIVNYVVAYFSGHGKASVESPEQIAAVIVFSAIMGLTFGVIFGVMDIEDEVKYQFRLTLMKEELYCYPIGAAIGFLCGCVNEYLKKDVIGEVEFNEEEI